MLQKYASDWLSKSAAVVEDALSMPSVLDPAGILSAERMRDTANDLKDTFSLLIPSRREAAKERLKFRNELRKQMWKNDRNNGTWFGSPFKTSNMHYKERRQKALQDLARNYKGSITPAMVKQNPYLLVGKKFKVSPEFLNKMRGTTPALPAKGDYTAIKKYI